MKNIAIIVQKLHGGGAERTAANLSLLMSKHFNVHLIVFDASVIKYPYEGVLHDLKLPPSKGRLGKLGNIRARVREIKRIKKEENISASISLMMGANIVNAMSRVNDKIITSVRIQMSKSRAKTKFEKWWNSSQMRYISKHSDYIVALSKGVEEDLVANFEVPSGKALTIYNPCDGEMLKEKAKVHFDDAAMMPEHSITTMGRFTEQKGHWHLIRAIKEVKKSVPDVKLYILGEGPLGEKLKELAYNLGVADNVVFLGFVEAPHAFIMKSRAFIFPSLFEGLGNVLLEAMACDTPCIATDCFSGPREILAPGTKVRERLLGVEKAEYGMLVSVGDYGHFNADEPLTEAEKQLAKAIVSILLDDELYCYYQKQAQKRIADFSPETIASQWLSLM